MNIAIIPARAGSKRIPKKNILEFNGVPFLTSTINFLKSSGLIDTVFVSTDSEEISILAEKSGAKIPFIRPKDISNDNASTIDVIKHFIENTEEVSIEDNILCVYPVNPFLEEDDLKRAFELLDLNENKFVVPVTSYSHPIQRALVTSKEGLEPYFNSAELEKITQRLDEVYHDVGQFYLARAGNWQKKEESILKGAIPIFIPRHRAIDIDTHEDLTFARIMFDGNSLNENSDKS